MKIKFNKGLESFLFFNSLQYEKIIEYGVEFFVIEFKNKEEKELTFRYAISRRLMIVC